MKDFFKNWLKGFVILFSLSALLAGIAGCSLEGEPGEVLNTELVTLRVLSKKTLGGSYWVVEFKDGKDPGDLFARIVSKIEGFDEIYREGNEYIISARKYRNEENGEVSYNYIETIETIAK